MRSLAVIIVGILSPFLASATLPAAVAWEVRPTVGSATNGGGFVTGATGTDYSLNNNKNGAACSNCGSTTVNLSETDAVTTNTTTVTSASCNCNASMVGNVIYLAGTGTTTGWYQVVSLTFASPPAAVITVDRATGSTGGTGVTMNVGGSMDDVATALGPFVTSNKIWLKASGTLTRTAALTLTKSQTPSRTQPYNYLIGYSATRGDCVAPGNCVGRPTIQLTSGSSIHVIDGNGITGWSVQNLIVDCNSQTSSTGIYTSGQWVVYNNKVTNCKTDGIYLAQNDQELVQGNEVTGGPSGCNAGINAAGQASMIVGNWVHGQVCNGINLGSYCQAINNIVSGITGGTNSCINISGQSNTVLGNSLYSCVGAGIDASANQNFVVSSLIRNNIIEATAQGLYGAISGATCGTAAQPWFDGNAFFNNTTNRKCADDTGTVNAINGSVPYTNTMDQILTASPFVSASTNDFRLNSTVGGGSGLKTSGWPGALLGITLPGYNFFGSLGPLPAGSNTAFSQ
jgi:hypothetical protein